MARPLPRFAAWLIPFVCLGLLASVQGLADRSGAALKARIKQAYLNQTEPLIPSLPVLRTLSFGHPALVADILWVQTIQYFGTGNPYGNYPSLGKMLDTITQLDRKFEEPYEFALVVLPFMGQTNAAVSIGQRAQAAIPADQRGLIDFYLASTYLLNVKDYKLAAHFYQQSASEPNHPGAASDLAGTALNRLNGSVGDRQAAIEYWHTAAENAKTDDEAERDTNWEDQMRIVLALETVAEQFKTDVGRYPLSLDELVQRGYVQSIPASPVNRVLTIDSATGKVNFDTLKND